MSKKREQVTVTLDPALREFIERAAERETRSVSAQIRHLVVEAARKSGNEQVAA